ncbi:MAG: isoprenylcysteine carboxylmethyltransferase family protein [Dehalococcoidia bacterium]|nr:isoprenylcysteine carboxylmethyltransferase family protein [Dehalococcoidia bacterium]
MRGVPTLAPTSDRPPALSGSDRLWWLVSTTGLATIYAFFAVIHLRMWMETGELKGLGVVFQESLIVALFIARRPASRTTRSPVAWVATGVGAFSILLLRPGGEAIGGLGTAWAAIQVVAAIGYVTSLGFLGRSFGVVPALRGVQTSGPYAWVRHPVYAAYLLGNIGYFLESPTAWNVGVIVLQTIGQVVRMDHEERVLSEDPGYVEYKARVRWRLVPGLY